MTAWVVVDIGNTRVKWGRCTGGRLEEACALPPDDVSAWQEQLGRWQVRPGARWVLAGVVPSLAARLAEWLRGRGHEVRVLALASQLPLRVALERPEQAGIDRLLDAVAVGSRKPPGVPALIVDAGSAVTVDCVDGEGTFLGGAILPGIRLMAEALHRYTALLPLVARPFPVPPPFPGVDTRQAMHAGIYWGVAGAAQALRQGWREKLGQEPVVYVTGGDGDAIAPALAGAELWPHMTLDGIRIAAEVGQ